MDIGAIKKEFPVLRRDDSLAYLDSAASAQSPDVVCRAVASYYEESGANAHRGLYAQAQKATDMLEDAREEAARFLRARKEEIIFTFGATHAANLAARSLARFVGLSAGDEIAISEAEHNGAFLPFLGIARDAGARVRIIPAGEDGIVSADAAAASFSEKTKIAVIGRANNITGGVNDTSAIARITRARGIIFVSDAAQAAGHMPISADDGPDFLFFSSHKMCGPLGTGVLWGRGEILEKMENACPGGGTVASFDGSEVRFLPPPGRFESGTQNIAGAAGMSAAMRFLSGIGIADIAAHSRDLAERAARALREEGAAVYTAEHTTGIVSFRIDGIHPHDVAQVCADMHVAVRAGEHCAPRLCRRLGASSLVRASFYLYNTEHDIEKLVAAVRKAKSIFL